MAGRFTKAQAAICVDMLDDDQQAMIRAMWNRTPLDGIPEATPQSLISLSLVRKDTNLMDGKEIWLLTEMGKQVAKQL